MYSRIRKARENAGYTREQFAEKLNVSVSYLAEVERGRTNISLKTLTKICSLLGLSSDYLLFGTERESTELLLDKLRRINPKYQPMVTDFLNHLLALSYDEDL